MVFPFLVGLALASSVARPAEAGLKPLRSSPSAQVQHPLLTNRQLTRRDLFQAAVLTAVGPVVLMMISRYVRRFWVDLYASDYGDCRLGRQSFVCARSAARSATGAMTTDPHGGLTSMLHDEATARVNTGSTSCSQTARKHTKRVWLN